MKKNILCLSLLIFLCLFVITLKAQSWVPVGAPDFASNVYNGYSFAANASIVLDNNSKPYVVYERMYDNGYLPMTFDGTDWVDAGSPALFSYEYVDPTIAVDVNGNPYMMLHFYGGDSLKEFNGTDWVNTDDNANIPTGAFALDANGTPYIAFSDRANAKKVTVKKFTGGSWVTVGNAGFSAGAAITPYYLRAAISITINKNGTPFVAYVDSVNSKIVVMKYDGSNWAAVGTGISVTFPNNLQILASAAGTPFIGYVNDDTYGAVLKFDGSSWVSVGSSPLFTGSRIALSLSLDNYDTLYAACKHDDTNAWPAHPPYVTKFNGTSWVNIDSAGLAAFTNYSCTFGPHPIAFDKANHLFFSFADSNENKGATVMEFANGIATSTKNVVAKENNQLKVFPNPSTGTVIVNANKCGYYLLHNALGQLLNKFYVKANEEMQISDLSNGMYFISSENDPGINQKTVVAK